MDNETIRSSAELLDLELYNEVLWELDEDTLESLLSDRDEKIPEHLIKKELRKHGKQHD